MSASSAYELRARPGAASFREAWTVALNDAVHRLGEAALDGAFHGTAHPVFFQGEQIGERPRFDEKLMMSRQKGSQPFYLLIILRLRDLERFGAWREAMRPMTSAGQDHEVVAARLAAAPIARSPSAVARGKAAAMRIVPFTDDLAPAFRAINAAWIAAMFTLEPHDEHVLSHPREAIVERGGTILFALADDGGEGGTPVGTGALMPTAPGAVELTKMGVLAAARGSGAGAMLLAALIERARAMPGIDTFYLLTNRRAEAAIHLYEKAGFVHDAAIMARYGATYARCDVAMRFPLDQQRTAS